MKPALDEEMIGAAVLALQNERFVLGESVYKFEEEFAGFCGTRYAVSTGSGTGALQIALQATGIGPGDDVLTTPFSFIATSNAILHSGARPVFSDVGESDFNLEPQRTVKAITPEVRAILPVHLYGHPCKIREFREISDERGLRLVEDACQAHGATYDGAKVGSFGDAGCFSFYPSKNMTVCGDGGMIVTNDEDIAEAARSLRDCGRLSKYEMSRVGYTSRMNTANAAIGRVQLRRLDRWNADRREIAGMYRAELEGVPGLHMPPSDSPAIQSVYHLFVVRNRLRGRIIEQLKAKGIESQIHYPIPIHLQIPYRQAFGYSIGAFPQSERLSNEVVSLPMHPFLSDNDVRFVCQVVKETVQSESTST